MRGRRVEYQPGIQSIKGRYDVLSLIIVAITGICCDWPHSFGTGKPNSRQNVKLITEIGRNIVVFSTSLRKST